MVWYSEQRFRKRRKGIWLGLLGLVVGLAAWWASAPRTPEALFRERCSTCHELRTARVCTFAPELRPAIVETMRRLHGADKVITDHEARVIARYLEESLTCP